MRVWLTELTEPLPIAPGARLMRCGILAQTLAQQGHDVLWWSSAFDHSGKAYRTVATGVEIIPVVANYRIRLLPGPPYRRNVSLARVRHHRAVARAFAQRAGQESVPDLIVCSLPTLEVTEAAVRYALVHEVPVVVDVRDLWPDAFLTIAPASLRGMLRLLLRTEFRRAQFVLHHAAAILGVSAQYLEWGVRYAGRAPTERDAVFPLGYPHLEHSTDEVERARLDLAAAGVDPSKTICCFVGSFGRTYDLLPVLTAARQLNGAGWTQVQFVIAGDGERAAEWRSRAAGLPNVVFTGWLSATAIAALLTMAGVGVAAYATGAPQGLPNKVFEYMSAGLPVLSSLHGETERLLAESGCGLTYEASDPESFSTALQGLLENPQQRTEMGRRALERFRSGFAASAIYQHLASHLIGIAMHPTQAPTT